MTDADYKLPGPSAFPSLSEEERTTVIRHLFERSPTLESLILPEFSTVISYGELIAHSRALLLNLASESRSDQEKRNVLLEILAAHPRLGAGKIDSAHSVAEQASLQGEAETLAALNKEYEEQFPGLRYVVFVNGRTRDVIMANMRERIRRGQYELEKIEGANAMCDIAIDRARKLGADFEHS
ncbi:Oxo-4-hydroxy-4-carboxy-5-ureidoimidazoline decarboxylase [Lipomyces tetrasporus]|uniref:Oxo-4-hydroxy-4-carboxy-5-ureidoimidazoline decarboxylase n=1 Tax=Lipomyces tetrasporus TaxID=54092 RepID=A0AAD7QZC0_9ASCO|nr:Oxo-4-hydroxy-4-carboxy-5-ureidoimidazoline decarboxylase [Lipomyces tetrasporus]KAJ8103953.1 Oxo-4-hydroxy-4-carboxy-5-ureidoimidazoline decarboxylase [Lipomyces tetrasporus]